MRGGRARGEEVSRVAGRKHVTNMGEDGHPRHLARIKVANEALLQIGGQLVDHSLLEDVYVLMVFVEARPSHCSPESVTMAWS